MNLHHPDPNTHEPAGDVVVRHPYDDSVVGMVPADSPDGVARACETARCALSRGLPQHERVAILDAAAATLSQRHSEFAETIALEAGKPISTARSEVLRCIDTLRFSASEARRLAGEMVPMAASAPGIGRIGFTMAEPIGVVAAITPFNFPLNLVAHKLAPAIAAGCPVVLKPAELTPLSAIRLVELLIDAGLPSDWISVVNGIGRSIGVALVEHPVPAMVTFTGSTSVGWQIAAAAPRKKVSLELGSTAPLIVQPGADLDDVARKVAVAGYSFAGQSCISTQRLLAHGAIHDELVDKIRAQVEHLVVGDPLEEGTDVGPLITHVQAQRVEQWVAEAAESGAEVLTGGERDGGIVQPALVANVDPESRLWTREVFGPVVATMSYGHFDEALLLANDTDLALQAGVFTPRLDEALTAIDRLDFGGVLINEVPTYRADQQPYGGVRDAGNTREGPAYTVHEMTNEKFVLLSRLST